MSNKAKFILTFVEGVVVGVFLTIGLAYFVYAKNASGNGNSNPNVELFEKPAQTIPAKEFSVMQVLDDGSALAIVEDLDNGYGTVVLFQAKEGVSYYDDQKIKVPSGKVAKQVGTFKYETAQHMIKTVPVVEFFSK